ncbi:glycosyltransferase, partial [bacterium]|nr:glycosyltransferase [bacterium]
MLKSNKPLISVVLPTYKRVENLKEAIESVLNQSYKNLELIIIDDTPDNTVFDIISTINDSR